MHMGLGNDKGLLGEQSQRAVRSPQQHTDIPVRPWGCPGVPAMTSCMRGAVETETSLGCQRITASGLAWPSQAPVFGEVVFTAVSNNRQDVGVWDTRGWCLTGVCLFAWDWHSRELPEAEYVLGGRCPCNLPKTNTCRNNLNLATCWQQGH